MGLFQYSVQIGAGTARMEGGGNTEDSAREYARKHSRTTSLIVFVTSTDEPGKVLAAYEEGGSIPVELVYLVAREGYGGLAEYRRQWQASAGEITEAEHSIHRGYLAGEMTREEYVSSLANLRALAEPGK